MTHNTKLLKEYSKVQVEINSLEQSAKASKDRDTAVHNWEVTKDKKYLSDMKKADDQLKAALGTRNQYLVDLTSDGALAATLSQASFVSKEDIQKMFSKETLESMTEHDAGLLIARLNSFAQATAQPNPPQKLSARDEAFEKTVGHNEGALAVPTEATQQKKVTTAVQPIADVSKLKSGRSSVDNILKGFEGVASSFKAMPVSEWNRQHTIVSTLRDAVNNGSSTVDGKEYDLSDEDELYDWFKDVALPSMIAGGIPADSPYVMGTKVLTEAASDAESPVSWPDQGSTILSGAQQLFNTKPPQLKKSVKNSY